MHCLGCDYNLRDLTEHRCPECGRGFDPSNPGTWAVPRAMRWQRPAKIAGWVAAVIPAFVAFLLTVGMALGHDDAIALLLYWMLAAIPMKLAVITWVVCLILAKRAPSRRAVVTAVVLFLLNLSLLTEWPMHAGFALHRGALNKQVQQAQAGNAPAGATQIGIYRAHSVGVKPMPGRPDAVIIKIGGGHGPDHLVHGMTDAEIEANFNIWSYRRLNEDWHIVHED